MEAAKLPYFTKLTFDRSLNLSDERIEEKLRNGTTEETRSKEARLESVIAYPETRVFAKFASAAYQDRKKNESQSEYETRLQLPEGWRLLTTATGTAFKDTINGYFGAAFWHPVCCKVVIAHRGTVPTNMDALRADLMGILNHKYVKQMNAACTFTHRIHDAIVNVEKERRTSFEIFFTGHSLGAWLAQITTFSLKYLKPRKDEILRNRNSGYHAHTVVFDSPGCKDNIQKMVSDFDVRYAGRTTRMDNLDITSYLSSPNFVNCCNPHLGKLYRIYPEITAEDYVKYSKSSHSMDGILDAFETTDPIRIKEVVDWPLIKIELWQWKIWKLPENILGKEYRDFFQFANDLNDYDPNAEETEVDLTYTATNEANSEEFVQVRYQTKDAETNECGFDVFTDSELHFLQRFQQLKMIPNSLFHQFTEEYQSKIANNLNKLILNAKDRTIGCEDNRDVFRLIPYVKTLLRLDPDLNKRAGRALTDVEVRKQIYKNITEEYRKKMEGLTGSLRRSDWSNVLDSENHICHVLAEYGTESAMAKVLKALETKPTSFTIFAFELLNLVTTETFFHLTEFLNSETSREVLFAIECKCNSFTNKENFRLVRNICRGITDGRTNAKLILITDVRDELSLEEDSLRVNDEGITWDELTNQAQEEILSKKIITFQGNPEQKCLQEFIRRPFSETNLAELKEIIDPETLLKFLRADDVLVGPNIPYLVNFYIPRIFKYNPYIKEEVFDEVRDDDVVAVWANNREELDCHIFTDFRKNRRFQTVTSDEDFEGLCLSNSKKNVHCLKLKSNSLVWHKTKGSLNLLRNNIRDEYLEYSEETILDELEGTDSKTLIVSDAPGMGKSTVLAVLAQRMKERTPSHWVVLVNLNDCAKALNDAIQNEISLDDDLKRAKFLTEQIFPRNENTNLRSAFERKLFEKSLTAYGGVVLIFDAFDEISPVYEDLVIQLLKISPKSRLEKLVLSTRPHTKEQLEDQLSSLSRTMVPFSRQDQKRFLIQFWEKILIEEEAGGEMDLEKCANDCVDQIQISIDADERDFLGIPLQCVLLAEYALDKIIRGENQPEMKDLSFMELYEAFVRKKMNIYHEEKNSNKKGNISAENQKQFMETWILKAHRQYALRLLLSRDKWDELDYPEIEEDRETLETEVLKAGLMLKTGDNPQYVHRTFAEFFALGYILDLTKNEKNNDAKLSILSNEALLQPEFGVVRILLDGLIRNEQKTEETTVILRSLARFVSKKWTVDEKICLNRNGDTFFHVLLRGKYLSLFDTLLKMLMEVCQKEIVKSLIRTPGTGSDFPLNAASLQGHLHIVSSLLNNGANVNDFSYNGAAPLLLACQNGHLEIVSFLLEKGAIIDCCTNDKVTPLFVSCQNGHLEIVSLLLQKGANIDARENDDWTALHIASQNGHLEIVSLLLDKGANIDSCTYQNETPLYSSSRNGHLEVASFLFDKGANIDSHTIHGLTPLYKSCQNGHLEFTSFLLEKGVNINAETINNWTALHIASQNGHLEIVSLLLENGVNVNACTNDDWTALHIASQVGYLKIVSLLLENSAHIDSCTNGDGTSLYISCKNDDLEFFNLSIEKGDNINACTNDDCTALHIASKYGHLEIVSLLLEKGANIEARTSNGATPLYISCLNGHLEIVSLILEKGVNFNVCTNNDWTALHIASQNGHLDIISLLLENGANIDCYTNDNATPLYISCGTGYLEIASLLLEKGVNFNACKDDGWTALHIASQNGHLEIVSLLLQKGVNINACTINDWTALHIASQNGHLDIISLLLENGANIDCYTNDNATPLYISCEIGYLEIASLLLEKGVNFNACKDDGWTALHIASQNGHLEIVVRLLEKGVNINALTIDRVSSLYISCQNAHQEIVSLLLQKGANIDAPEKDDWTALHIASQNGHLEIVSLLLEKGANIDVRTNRGMTPLYISCQNGHQEIVKLLLENGADINAPMNIGKTPLNVACVKNHKEIAKFLRENGAVKGPSSCEII